jgi:hypothetical protein
MSKEKRTGAPWEIERKDSGNQVWLHDQLESLADAVEYGLDATPTQMARLLREVTKGRDWRHGGWK